MKRILKRSAPGVTTGPRDHPSAALRASAKATRGTIVIAEDDDATRELLCAVLRRASFAVIAVENGKLACDAVRLQRPDVILLDWMMPVMDGLRTAELLKADVATRAIPIVMITTHSQIDDRHLALSAGLQDFVTKPFEPSELVLCVEQQMRWRTIIVSARASDRRAAETTDYAAAIGLPNPG